MSRNNKKKYEFDSEENLCSRCKEKKNYDCLLELGTDPGVDRDEINKILIDVSTSAKKHQRKFKDNSPDDIEFSEESQDISYADTLEEVKKDVRFNSAINYETNQGRNVKR